MIDGIFLQVFSLLYMCMLSFVYFKKDKIKSYENRLFSRIIICNIIGLVIHLLLYYLITTYDSYSIITIIVSKIYLIYLLLYMTIFSLYDVVISIYANKSKQGYNKYLLLFIIIFILFSIFIIKLPINFFNQSGKIYTYGSAVNIVYYFSFAIIAFNIILLLTHIKEVFNKKYYPLFLYIFLGFVTMIIQYKYPFIQLMTAKDSFIILLMYFTIENPDVKMLEEYHKAKELAEKSNNEKAMFLLDVAESIRRPATDIKNMVSEALDSNNKDEYLRMIRTNTESILTSVNETLDVNTIESHDLKIVNTKYNAKTLFRQLTLSVKEKLEDKDIDLQVSIDDTLPDYLYGDSIRLKEIMSELLDNSVKYTKKGFIALTLKYIIRNDVCRLLITLEDSGSGIESDRLNEVFNQDGDSKTKLGKIKSLVNLIGGTIVANSEYGTGTKFTIVLDQKLVEDNKNDKLAQFEDKYMNTKKILLFDYDEKDYKDLKKYLRNYDIDIDYVTESVDGLNKIRNKEKYNLILIKEDMPKLDGDAIVFKLKEIPNYKAPYVMLIENAKHTKYREYLVTPLKKDLLLEIIDKYVKK